MTFTASKLYSFSRPFLFDFKWQSSLVFCETCQFESLLYVDRPLINFLFVGYFWFVVLFLAVKFVSVGRHHMKVSDQNSEVWASDYFK